MFVLSMLLLGLLIWSGGCSSTAKSERGRTRKWISKILPYNVHVRRPSVLGAELAVGPGGPDYQTTPLPGENFDCMFFSEIFTELNADKIRECLKSIKDPVTVLYRLKRDPAPVLVIDDVEGVPACLVQVLPRIPLPREIFFQSTEEGILSCYASRLDIEADELLWVKVPKARAAMKLGFPMSNIPQGEEEIRLLLLSWMMTPFWDSQGRLASRVVPDNLCLRCMGETKMLKPTDPLPLLWPN